MQATNDRMQQRRLLLETAGRRHDHSRGKGVPSSASLVSPGTYLSRRMYDFCSASDSQDPAKPFVPYCLRLFSVDCWSFCLVYAMCTRGLTLFAQGTILTTVLHVACKYSNLAPPPPLRILSEITSPNQYSSLPSANLLTTKLKAPLRYVCGR